MDKVAGLLNGPVGSLLGAGLHAVVNKGPSTTMGSERQKIMNFYDNVGAHLHGAMSVLKPALEMKDMIMNNQRCKSADALLAKPQESQIAYYTPQKNRCGCKCDGKRMKSDEESTSRKYANDSQYSKKKNKREMTSPDISRISGYSSMNKERRSCSTFSSHASSSTLSYNSTKSSRSKGKDELKNCAKCGIGIDKVKILSLISCGHVFCGLCIAKENFIKCPICKKRMNSSDVTRVTNYSFD